MVHDVSLIADLPGIAVAFVMCLLAVYLLYTRRKNKAVQDSFTNATVDFDIAADLRAIAAEASHGVEDDAFVMRCVYRDQRLRLVSRSEEDEVWVSAPEIGALCGDWVVVDAQLDAARVGDVAHPRRTTGDAEFDARYAALAPEGASVGWLSAELRGALMALSGLVCVRSIALSGRGLEVAVDREHLLLRPQLEALLAASAGVCAAVRDSSARQALAGDASVVVAQAREEVAVRR